MVRIPGNRDPRWFLSLVLSFVLMAGTGNAWDVLSHRGYRLGANDVVKIQVFGEEDLTVERKIEGDGNINFPLLGAVQVAGKTIPELQEYLRSQLGVGYVRKPKVTAFVVRYRNFYLNGEVRVPGGYAYEEGLSVQKAISMAGGLTEKAERGTFQVLRRVNGHEETVAVGLDSLVLPDDIIVVAEGQRVYVSGRGQDPGTLPL
jgi:polysaccharide export outer membrane protein